MNACFPKQLCLECVTLHHVTPSWQHNWMSLLEGTLIRQLHSALPCSSPQHYKILSVLWQCALVGSLGDGMLFTHDNSEHDCVKHESFFCNPSGHADKTNSDKEFWQKHESAPGRETTSVTCMGTRKKKDLVFIRVKNNPDQLKGAWALHYGSITNTPTHDRLLLMISKQPCASLSVTEADFYITVSFKNLDEHFKDRRKEGMEGALSQSFGEQRQEHKSGTKRAERRGSILPYGQDDPWGTDTRTKRQMMKNRFFCPEKKVWVEAIMWEPWSVCLSCSPCPVGSMLLSGTLFTFWTQLTSPSLSPLVLPSPSLQFSLPLSLSLFSHFLSSTSLWLQVTSQPKLRALTCSRLQAAPQTLQQRAAGEWLQGWWFNVLVIILPHTHTAIFVWPSL